MERTDVEVLDQLRAVDVAAIVELAARAAADLGREAITDRARRALAGASEGLHLLERRDGAVVAYGLVLDDGSQLEVELLGDDVTSGVLAAAAGLATARNRGLRVWVHGLHGTGAAPLPGLEVVRSLDRLHRALPAPPPEPLDASVSIRNFRPGIDDVTWLALNAASFAEHPDQGALALEDLTARIAEPWFDPAGFFLAWEGTELIGFCWTKMHRDAWRAVGEIYVIGVAPHQEGRGLGRTLLRRGLARMVEVGMDEAMLYVESDNRAAQRLYASEGFDVEWRDLCWSTSTR